jgi:hypothetical protein
VIARVLCTVITPGSYILENIPPGGGEYENSKRKRGKCKKKEERGKKMRKRGKKMRKRGKEK